MLIRRSSLPGLTSRASRDDDAALGVIFSLGHVAELSVLLTFRASQYFFIAFAYLRKKGISPPITSLSFRCYGRLLSSSGRLYKYTRGHEFLISRNSGARDTAPADYLPRIPRKQRTIWRSRRHIAYIHTRAATFQDFAVKY